MLTVVSISLSLSRSFLAPLIESFHEIQSEIRAIFPTSRGYSGRNSPNAK